MWLATRDNSNVTDAQQVTFTYICHQTDEVRTLTVRVLNVTLKLLRFWVFRY